jgi:hypothetical protein
MYSQNWATQATLYDEDGNLVFQTPGAQGTWNTWTLGGIVTGIAAPISGPQGPIAIGPSNPRKTLWQKNWDCVANVGWPVLKDDLSPFSLGVGTAADAASQASQASLQAAATWSVSRGLTVPLRSGIVRAGVGASEVLGRLSFALTMGNVIYAEWDAINAEHKGCTF